MFGFHWYGLIIGIGVLAAIQASTWLARRRKIDEEVLWKAAWWALAGGLIGARLYHVLDLWTEIYALDPISSLYIWNGGLGIIGGLIGGFIGLWLYKRFMNYDLRFMNLLDLVFFGLPIGQAIGRLGNWINQEVYGLPTNLPWGIYIDNKSGRFHPLFAYEAFWMLLGFALMLLAEKTDKLNSFQKSFRGRHRRPWESGLVSDCHVANAPRNDRKCFKTDSLGWIKRSYTGFYLVWYGAGRFWLDFLRPDDFVWFVGVFNIAQAISVLMILLGIRLLINHCALFTNNFELYLKR